MELELKRQSKLWQLLTIELQPAKAKNIDQALRTISGHLKMSSISVNQLCLVRYAHMVAEMDLEHPLLPAVIQRFFGLYFGRTETTEIGADSWAVGQRIMTSSSSLSLLLKRMVLGWMDATKRCENDAVRASFFQSCCLWVEDVKLLEPNVYLPTLAPNYSPSRLLQLFQGSDLWLDLCGLSTIYAERQALRESWNKERNLSSIAAFQKLASPSHLQRDTIFTRLQTYPDPIRLAQVSLDLPYRQLPLGAIQNPVDLRKCLDPHLRVIVDSVDQFSRRMAELTSLDCHYAELLAELYSAHRSEKTVVLKCSGTQTGACSGSGVVKLSCEPWKMNTSIRKQADSNRQDASRLRSAFHDPNAEWLSVTALLLEDCVEQIRASSDPGVLETGGALFYILVELVNEDSNSYLPAKQLLSTCLEGLG